MTRTLSLLATLLAVSAAHPARAGDGRVVRAAGDAELARAVAAARPGDTVLVADGTYREPLVVRVSGTGDRPITVKAEHAHKAVFARKGQAARVEGSHLRFEGLVFDSEYGNCTAVRATGTHIRFLDCEVRRPGTVDDKAGGDGLQFFDSADCLVERCHVHHCLASKGGEGVDSHGIRFTHSRGMTVRGCLIDLVSGDCVQVDPDRKAWDDILIEDCKLSGGRVTAGDPFAHPRFPVGGYTSENAVDTKCPPTGRPRITVRNCEAYGFRGPIGNAAAFNIKEACEAVIDRCTIHDCEIGLRLRGPARVRVTNCVLYANDTHCRYEDSIPLLHVLHCTFGEATGKGRGAFQEQRPAAELRVRGCLFLGDKPRQAGDPSNRAAAASAFVDAARHDYRPAAPLPATAKGPAADDPRLAVDRAGTARPADRLADAGAFQFRPK